MKIYSPFVCFFCAVLKGTFCQPRKVSLNQKQSYDSDAQVVTGKPWEGGCGK